VRYKLLVEAAIKVLPASGQDRAIALPTAGGYLVAVADGAGGTGGGAVVADLLIVALSKITTEAVSMDWWTVLLEFDEELAARRSGGETTAVVAFVDGDRVRGASVGDSEAWLITPTGELSDLTVHQRRKPLIGSGEALPVEFEAERRGGRLLLATDGLTKYAPPERICSLATKGTVAEALDALANCVRLPSGGLQDDVAVVIVAR
jgi:serine/threonine protein phosphatase PrpC